MQLKSPGLAKPLEIEKHTVLRLWMSLGFMFTLGTLWSSPESSTPEHRHW